jgi:hypothetical protein
MLRTVSAISLLLLTFDSPVLAENPSDTIPPMSSIRDEVARLLHEQDSYAAVQFIQHQGTPPEVMTLYGDIQQWLYNEQKNVAGMIALSRAGIQYGLTEADRCATDQPDLANSLRGSAKALAFNLASNTWPGWNDEGITPTESDRRVGLDAARLNLRLAIELKRDHLPLCNAHWILGAHHLADGHYDDARDAFETAADHARQANSAEFEAMTNGYAAMASILQHPENSELRRPLDENVAILRRLDNDDSRFFADQLESVLRLFSSPQPAH